MITAADLAGFKPLSKPLHSWPFNLNPINGAPAFSAWAPENRPLLKEFARITHSIPLSLEYWKPDQLTAANEVCAATGARICLQTSPSFANTPAKCDDWTGGFANAFMAWTSKLAVAAVQMKNVSTVCVDAEGFKCVPVGKDNPDDVAAKHALIRQTINGYFPAAKLIEFCRGAAGFSGQAIGDMGHYPRDKGADNYSTEMYYGEWAACQDVYRATLANADADGVADVIPFVALGGCQPRLKNGWGQFDYTVPHNWAWQAGLELFNPWARQQPQAANFPDFGRSSCAYLWPAAFVNDAAGLQLVDLLKGAAGQ